MPYDEKAMRKELPKLKAALTRAKNSKDPRKVIAAIDTAFARFDVIGFPDNWAHWEVLKDSALMAIRHNVPFSG